MGSDTRNLDMIPAALQSIDGVKVKSTNEDGNLNLFPLSNIKLSNMQFIALTVKRWESFI